jgi:putative membrane protein
MTAVRLATPAWCRGFFHRDITSLRDSSLSRSAGPFPLRHVVDNRPMVAGYLWVKAFHIVFVASWFAGLFYLPRIFVNLALVPAGSDAERERLLLMARKLYSFSTLLMLFALALGLWLWLGYGVGMGGGQYWMRAKLALVLCVIGYQHVCRAHLRQFERLANRRSHRWYRVFNEVTVLLFTAIVLLAVIKPF